MSDGRLENWTVDQVSEEEFVIWGNIFGDVKNRFEDGTYIHTSGINNIFVEEGDLVVTRNSEYTLGKKYNSEGMGV